MGEITLDISSAVLHFPDPDTANIGESWRSVHLGKPSRKLKIISGESPPSIKVNLLHTTSCATRSRSQRDLQVVRPHKSHVEPSEISRLDQRSPV